MRGKGFTLIEILVALAVMAVLMLAFVRFFSGTLRTAASLQAQNELLNEGQLAHHLIVSRIKEAWYVWPPGSVLRLANSGWTTENSLRGGQDWTVGPTFLAMILPPEQDQTRCSANDRGCFRFFAYYPMKRSFYLAHASPVEALEPDPRNDRKVWVLMEYRAYYKPGRNCPVKPSGKPNPGIKAYRGNRGRLLVDYVQPLADPWDPGYNYPALFSFTASRGKVQAVTVSLRFAREVRGQVYRVPASKGPFSITVEPRNLGVQADPNGDYCK